ncbi:ATPase PAAT isoform X2 [Mugil cephalus]|uniref:ATPase PAAT isoform X2 n=1 Tax=Mugil cephalus TaxID=48193 RepID=UPI001FB67B15|nr:ATPase PAAT isoform X2 [Mugil cephalus]
MVEVGSGPGWVCDGGQLSDILHPVQDRVDVSELEETSTDPVLLRQVDQTCPCVLTLRCPPHSSISRLVLLSQAPTMEVYDHTGQYCGTVRGDRTGDRTGDHGDHTHSPEGRPFYEKQLVLRHPSSSCELLSLAGRTRVLLSRVVVGVQSCPVSQGPGIDMGQVQSLVEDMGTSLSPGAQNLMDMVQFQQKNQTSSLEGFLPLLMGAGAALSRGRSSCPHPPADRPPADRPPADCPPVSMSPEEDTSSSPAVPSEDITSQHGGPISSAHLSGMMSQLLSSTHQAQLLPMLQSVCGQVTQLRLDEAQKKDNESWDLVWMERRLEEMERRLKEHMDRRLDALEHKLEQVLLRSLNHGVDHGAGAGGGGGGGGAGAGGGGGAGGAGGASEEPQTD